MSVPWAYSPQLAPSFPSTCRIDVDEARHLSGSRRLRPGDRLCIFDGRGVVADAAMGSLNRDGSFDAEIDGIRKLPPPSPIIEIASAVAKGDRLATLLESLGPLGAARWTPLACDHSVVRWTSSLATRSHRVLVACCKQSQQPWIPLVVAEASVESAVRDAVGRGLQVLVAHPSGDSFATSCGDATPAVPSSLTSPISIIIGPEGGLTHAELEAAQALGAKKISLGDSILRIELAVASALAKFRLP